MINLKKINCREFLKSDLFYLLIISSVAAVFLIIIATTRTFWMDETAVLQYYYQTPNPINFIHDYFIIPDNHPPLYYLLTIIAYRIVPYGEFGMRLISIMASVGILITTFYLAKLLFDDSKIAKITVLIMAVSPFFLQYGQMARYHSLTAFFVLLALYFLIKFFTKGNTKNSLYLFFLFSLITAYTDLPNFVYLLSCANAWFIFDWWKNKNPIMLKQWLVGHFIILTLFLPIVYLYYLRIKSGDGDFTAVSILGAGLMNWLTDFLIHFYQFFYSETVLPWNYLMFALGLIVLCAVAYKIFILYKNRQASKLSILLLLILGLISLNTVFLNVLNPRYNFIVYPKFVFGAFPLFLILIVAVILTFKKYKSAFILLIILFSVQIFGTYNLINLKNYFNASYFRGFDSFQYVKDNAKAGDCIIINGDMAMGLYDFYRLSYFSKLRPVSFWNANEFSQIKARSHCWFFSTGSDDQNLNRTPESKIPTGFKIVKNRSFTPLDATLQRVKEKMLGRGGYDYKYAVFLIEKVGK
ncbi:MAG: glycosyltransferase family 39 protein [bacterium]